MSEQQTLQRRVKVERIYHSGLDEMEKKNEQPQLEEISPVNYWI